jgi:membrane protease YdiL (CAAX protease family)
VTALWTLLVHELRTMVRDRSTWIGAGLVLLAYAATPLQPTALPAPATDAPTPCPADPPDVAVTGDWPPELPWPEPFVADGAAVEVSARLEDGVTVLRTSPPDPQVRACLRDGVAALRATRLRVLGLGPEPEALLTLVNASPPPPPPPLPPVSWPGLWLGAGAIVWVGGASIEMVPRRRQTGLLEQLRSTATGEGTLVGAWVLAATAWGLALLAAASAATAVAGAASGASWVWSGAPHAPALALLTAAVSARTSLTATDTQAAALRWFGVMFAFAVGGGLAWAVVAQPALAALVPFGGGLLAAAGWLGPWAWLADAVSVATAGALVAASAAALRSEDSAAAGADPVLARRAAGRWGPEALLLTSFGLASNAISGGAAFADRPVLGLAVVFGAALLLPALLAPVATGVPWRELLPLRAPRPAELALAVGLVPALVPVSLGLVWLAAELVPTPEALERLGRAITDLTSTPQGVLAIALLPAVCEEALYRGAIQGLLARGGSPWRANVGQAAAFAVAHLLPARLPWTFAMGLLLGALRRRTGSLVPGMVLHFLFNGTMVLLPRHLDPFGGG